ncbi:MAG TPA: Gfo/Idh/MocA family oxidoreductase, partial [Roseiflexaceae bacterium]|nr:Gfo/Idh/MocA family oxidoreductase [Roseiflexaceae bacterium]
MSREIGIGLIGYGAIGRLHALCYRMLPLAYPDLPITPRVAAVVTASAASAERAGRELGVEATTDLGTLLGHPAVALVDCCAPTGDHARIAQAVLQAGKVLFCEKPLAADAEEAARIAGLARERGLAGGVNYHFRQVPAIQEARRRVEAGLLGEVYGFHLRYYRSSSLRRDRPLTWRFAGPGSGVLADIGSHLIDLALHLLGPIATVSAHMRTVVAERSGADGRLIPVEADDA